MEELGFEMIGHTREIIDMLMDKGTLEENMIADNVCEAEFGIGAIIGTAEIEGKKVTYIANDTESWSEKFPMVFAGVIGLEEAYKMALAIYWTVEADKKLAINKKRPIILIVDTPGNALGKIEEIIGINKATAAYQLAIAEARKVGHPIIALVIGRGISGGFLCHGLQADSILALSKDFGTLIHVMPLTSISRITKLPIEKLEELSNENPVFAAGVDYFYKLGGVHEIINDISKLRETLIRHIEDVKSCKKSGDSKRLGPKGRALLGQQRGGRRYRTYAINMILSQFTQVSSKYLGEPLILNQE